MADPETTPPAPGGTTKREPRVEPKADRLNARQRAFIEHYLADPHRNGTKAALAAGYSPSQAQRSCEFTTHPIIAAEINRKIKLLEVRTEVTIARTLEELALLGFSNMGDYVRVTSDGDAYVDLSDLTKAQWAAVEEITTEEHKDGRGEDSRAIIKTKIKLASKNAALTLIAKYLGMLHDKLEVVHKYENMNGTALAAKRTDLADKRAEISARLREQGINVPGLTPQAPSTETMQ